MTSGASKAKSLPTTLTTWAFAPVFEVVLCRSNELCAPAVAPTRTTEHAMRLSAVVTDFINDLRLTVEVVSSADILLRYQRTVNELFSALRFGVLPIVPGQSGRPWS